MTNETSPRPWSVDGIDISDANGEPVTPLYFNEQDEANAALIVDAVNEYTRRENWRKKYIDRRVNDAARIEGLYADISDLEAERDRLRAELSDKTRNYEDVIACHQRTEEYLRGLIKRLITVREKVFWRKDEKTGMTYETRLMDEEEARKTVEEAKAAIGEGETPKGKGVGR